MARRATKKKNVKVEKVKVGDTSVRTEVAEDIVKKVFQRLMGDLRIRDSQDIPKFNGVLCNLLAYDTALETDEERTKYAKGETEVITKIRYPKTLGHIQDAASSLQQILFPIRQMYGSVAITPAKQKESAALVTVMNTHAKLFRHYTSYYGAIFDGLAFNRGIIETRWEGVKGWRSTARPDRRNLETSENYYTLKEGNNVAQLDVYNTILDNSVDFEEYAEKAGFYAKVERFSEDGILRLAKDGEIAITSEVKKGLRRLIWGNGKSKIEGSEKFYHLLIPMLGVSAGSGGYRGLYQERPEFVRDFYNKLANDEIDCDGPSFNVEKYIGGSVRSRCDSNAVNELLTFVGRIEPKVFGLGEVEELQIWEFKILNGEWLVGARVVADSHGLIPCNVTTPKTELGESSYSLAELLAPFQDGTNSLMNVFLRGARKDTNNGRTFYSANHVKLDQMADPSSGDIPVDLSDLPTDRRSLDAVVKNLPGNRVSSASLEAIRLLEDAMQDIFPVDQISQMANLNRPVDHQSRSVSQLSNTAMFVQARLIHEQLVGTSNFIQTQNIIYKQEALTIFNRNGEIQEIDPSIFKDRELEVAVSDGLRGIDTIAIANRIENLLGYMFQSGKLQAEFDLPAMTTFLLNMEGAHVDMDAFKYQNDYDRLEPEQKQAAFQLLQQAIQQAQQGEQE